MNSRDSKSDLTIPGDPIIKLNAHRVQVVTDFGSLYQKKRNIDEKHKICDTNNMEKRDHMHSQLTVVS